MVECVSRAAVGFVASRVPAGGLQNALPPSGWLLSEEATCRFPCCGVARNRNGIPASGVPAAASHFRCEEGRVHHWDRPAQGVAHGGRDRRRRTVASASCRCRRIVDNVIGCCVGRRRSSRGCGRSKARGSRARCWPSSSSRRARLSSMCRRRCRRGLGCWTRAAKTRPTRTTHVPRRSSRYGTATCGRSRSTITSGVAAVGPPPSPAHCGSDPCDLSSACAVVRR